MTAVALLPQPHSEWLARIRTVGLALGGRGVLGLGLGRSAVSAAAVPWWLAGGAPTPVAVYQPKGAASLAASYVNLVNPGTYDAAPGTAPTWDATNGWIFDATQSQYLTTGITPTSSWSAIIRASSLARADMWAFGNYAASGWGIQLNSSLVAGTIYYNGQGRIVVSNRTSGVWALAAGQGYYNGSTDGAAFTANANPSAAIFLGDTSGIYRRYQTAYVQAFAIYNTTLTAPQVAAVSAAMAAL